MRGLSLYRIPAGRPAAGVIVVRLHYSADPTMTPERVTQMKIAYPDVTMWDREMEVDENSRGGQKWFPEFDDAIHYVRWPEEDFTADEWTTWLACDPHPRRAHAFVWLIVNKYGRMIVPWSHWPEEENQIREQKKESRLHCAEYVERLHVVEKFGLFPPSRIDLMDPAGAGMDATEDENFFQRYQRAGINFRPAKKNREYAGYDKISEALRLVESEGQWRPTLTILRGGGDNDILVGQIKALRFKELRGIAAEEKDPPPDPLNKDKHLIDCLSYILLDGPRFVLPKWLRKRTRHEPIYATEGNLVGGTGY
jgi:hypothetical protein